MRALALLLVLGCNGKSAEPHRGSAGDPAWVSDPPNVLRDKILDVNAHLDVLKSSGTFAEYRDVLATVEHNPDVVAAEPFIFIELTYTSAAHAAPVAAVLKGVDPVRVQRVLNVGRHMLVGRMDSLGTGDLPSIVLGDVLAKTLAVKIGDQVTATVPDAKPNVKVFRVGGIFHVDFDEYDGRLAYAPLVAVQELVAKGDQVMGIEATVKDLGTSDKVAKAIETALGGPPYQVQDWYELNSMLFHALYGDRRP